MSQSSRKGEASPNRNRLVELSKVVETINRPGDLMWASAQDWLIEQMDALASPVSETGEHICQKCGLRVEPHRCGGKDAAF